MWNRELARDKMITTENERRILLELMSLLRLHRSRKKKGMSCLYDICLTYRFLCYWNAFNFLPNSIVSKLVV